MTTEDEIKDGLFNMTQEPVGDSTPFEEEAPEQPYGDFKEETVPPKKQAARVKGDDVLSYLALGAGTLLVNRRIDPPVGRCLQLEAPLIGVQIDKVIAGTFIDKLLQPLFSKGEMLEELGAVLALPIFVAMIERKPEWTPLLIEPLGQALGKVLEDTAPLIRKKKTSQRRYARSMSDISDAFDIPRGADPIDAILKGFIFQDTFEQETEEPVTESVS